MFWDGPGRRHQGAEGAMIRILASALLMARLACRRLEVDWELCLALWRNRPVIEVVLEAPAERKQRLIERIDQMFPY